MDGFKRTVDLEKVAFYVFCGLIFLLPLAFFPPAADWFDLPKETLLAVGMLLVLSLWLAKAVVSGKLALIKSPFLAPAFLLPAVSAVSALASDNKIFSLSLEPVVLASCALTLFVGSQLLCREKELNFFTNALLASGAVLALFSFLQNLLPFIPQLSKFGSLAFFSLTFSPTGSLLSTGVFLALLLPLAVGFYREKKSSLVSLIFLIILGVGLSTTVYSLYKNPPILLPAAIGWRIAANTLGQTPLSAFLGSAPGNFVDAFTAGKPIEFNTSRFWNLRFPTSSNFYFSLLTTTGIAGLAVFTFLAWKIIKIAKTRFEGGVAKSGEKGLLASLILGLVLFALLPSGTVALATFFALLAILTGRFFVSENASYAWETADFSADNGWLRPGVLLVALTLLAGTAFYLGRLVLADYYFAQSLLAAATNRGTQTYNLQIKAVTFNPWNEAYRVSYSQTNLALADALAGTPNLSDQQKQTVVALVQQAIREARIAAGLAPKRAGDWENLSLIYRSLVNFAQGAGDWALASQNQAVNFDSVNPRTRLDLGAIYFSQKNYQSAAQAFAAAVSLKFDFANAHYNLAQALKQLGQDDQARRELQLTASLICGDTKNPDCQKVNDEIAGLTSATPPAELSATPSAKPTNLPKAQTKPPAKISSGSGELAH